MTGTAGPLLETIRSSAATAAADLVTAARAEAESIRAAARTRAERARALGVGAHDRDSGVALSRTRAETAVRVGRETLAMRAAIIERIFAEAERRSRALAADPELSGLLVATFDDAVSYLPEGRVKVGCDSAVAAMLVAALEHAGRIAVDVHVVDGAPFGLTIESADGSMMVDGTFPRRLARERPRLAAALARRLLEAAK